MFDLKSIVQREPETVGPVEQGKKAEHEQIHPQRPMAESGRASVSLLGGSSHPRGKARANKNRWTGISIADTDAAGAEEEPQ